MSDLSDLRNQLDQLDDQLVETLARRLKIIDDVADHKKSDVKKLQDGRREKEILARLTKIGQSMNLDSQLITRIYREIIDHSTRRQEETIVTVDEAEPSLPRSVAHLGIEGSYSQMAAVKHFGASVGAVEYHSCASLAEAMEGVHGEQYTHAIVPIENTTAGTLNVTYDLLSRLNLSIVGEEIVDIDHCLLSVDGASITGIRKVYSHPQALAQCGQFLRTLSDCEQVSVSDTASAARMVKEEGSPAHAAVASVRSSAVYALAVLQRSISDQPNNMTRFITVGRQPLLVTPQMTCKTSLVFAATDEEGSLLRCLEVFHRHGINLTKLQSRPRPHVPWEYLFYVDAEGSLIDGQLQGALDELGSCAGYVKVFGSYPQRVPQRVPQRPAHGDEAPPKVKHVSVQVRAAAPAKSLSKKPYRKASRILRTDDTVIRAGNVQIGGGETLVIAGPCSVESRDQLMKCAKMVKDHGGNMLRGGCFKPRTSPYSFQGLGFEGLKLLHEAGKLFDLPIVTEVLDPADVKAVAEYADVLQIGTRNMQNYTLLNEVGKVDRPVMLKRGMMATIDEWLAAAEYILVQGNQQVILCERGIRTFETTTRHTLDIAAIPVVRQRSHLPIIVDPSHAAGNRDWVIPLAMGALAAGAQGLMVEIHPDPTTALCDGPQALTEEDLVDLMGRIR